MTLTSTIGILASIFTATSLLPQLIKIIKEKKADDISFGMLTALFVGLGLWIWYGYLIKDWILFISNAFSFLVNTATTLISLKYKNKL